MSNDNTEVPTVTIDGVTHSVTDFSNEVQQLVGIRNLWGNQLNDERLAAAKTEAALRTLDNQLAELVTKQLDEKAKEPAVKKLAKKPAKK